jgi:hypothetical protein
MNCLHEAQVDAMQCRDLPSHITTRTEFSGSEEYIVLPCWSTEGASELGIEVDASTCDISQHEGEKLYIMNSFKRWIGAPQSGYSKVKLSP